MNQIIKLLNAIQKQMLKHLKINMNDDVITMISEHVVDKFMKFMNNSTTLNISSSDFFLQLNEKEQIILLNLLNK
jgi:hypothetical protein